MKVLTTLNPFESERVIGLSPAPAAQVSLWNRRLNLFTGRALTSGALNSEQQGVAGRFALRGQMISSGIVAGLDVALDQTRTSLLMTPGFGITSSGEDVFVPLPLSITLRDISVYAPAAVLDGGPPPAPGALVARKLGDSLDTIVGKKLPVAKAGMLLLQPIVAETTPNFDPTDTCEEDPQNDAFSDAQLIDGCRLIYYAWPDEWLPLPASGSRWRNRLAYAIFNREAITGADDPLPWQTVGLPVGLIAFDSDWKPLFVDRNAVVREGGKAKRRTALLPYVANQFLWAGITMPSGGNQFLWEARIQQFVEQVTDNNLSATSPADFGAAFRFLPPAGLLPKEALLLGRGVTSRVIGTPFFPTAWVVNAAPVPTEQIDFALQASASMDELDTLWPETVNVLVPVPQIWYEPDLLQVMQVDPAFQQAVDQFTHQRELWLRRRLDIRNALSALVNSVTASPVVFPDPDPDAVEVEVPAATEIDTTIEAFKLPELPYGVTANSVDRLKALKISLRKVPGVQNEPAIKNDPPDVIPGGLNKFIALLQDKINRANDQIDFGFLHVQTDIYRSRQHLLGNDVGTRLATSPALSMIAQGVSAAATKDDLANLLKKVKQIGTGTPGVTGPAPAAPSSGTRGANRPSFFASPQNVFMAGAKISTSIGTAPLVKAVPGVRIIPDTGGLEGVPAKGAIGRVVKGTTTEGAAALFSGGAAAATSTDITQEHPIIGAVVDLRSTSVVERLADPPANEAKQFNVASKYSVLSAFIAMARDPLNPGIFIDDIVVPGFAVVDANQKITKEDTRTISAITNDDLGKILAGQHDPIQNIDESGFLNAGVRAMEHTIQILRLIEGRVHAYQDALNQCTAAMSDIGDLAAQATRRLTVIAGELAKTRHDVAFARALLAEETARVNGINDKRDQIVAQHVKFLAFVRPRSAEALATMQVRSLDPGITVSPIPVCLARNLASPPELRAMVNLLREAPLKWFVHIPILLNFLNRIDVLQTAMVNAKLRSRFKLSQAVEQEFTTAAGDLGESIVNIYTARKQTINSFRVAASNFDLSELAGRTWEQSRVRASEILSVGDLIDHGHYHPNVPRVSAEEIENIQKVCACLYSDLAAVLPSIRLSWAERLLLVASPLNLSNLASLPRWGEVPILERKEIQAIVDWLFSRVVATEPEAVAHINDLVRACILLASHVPVAEIATGAVIRPTPVMIDSRVDLAADLSRVSVGMHVLLYSGNQTVARGVVENLSQGQATARIITTTSTHLMLDATAKAHFASAEAFERNPFTAGKLL